MAFDAFIGMWGAKYESAVRCLIKDRDALLVFYDFPAEHWKHLQCHRKLIRDGAPPHGAVEGMCLEIARARNDLQTS